MAGFLTDDEVTDATGEASFSGKINLVRRGVESLVQEHCDRLFLQRTLTDKPLDVDGGSRTILVLPDWPVADAATFTLKLVTAWDTDGVPDSPSTVEPDTYELSRREGRLKKRSGFWAAGPGRYLVTVGAPGVGYDQSELDDPSTVSDLEDQRHLWTLKLVTHQVLKREWALETQNMAALDSGSFDGETFIPSKGLTFEERRKLRELKRYG